MLEIKTMHTWKNIGRILSIVNKWLILKDLKSTMLTPCLRQLALDVCFYIYTIMSFWKFSWIPPLFSHVIYSDDLLAIGFQMKALLLGFFLLRIETYPCFPIKIQYLRDNLGSLH